MLIECGVDRDIATRVISENNLLEFVLVAYGPVDALCMCFNWGETTEGYNYWKDVVSFLSRRKVS